MADINLGVGGANSAVAGGYDIDNSLKLERANSENLYRQIINGNRKTWTTSLWIKRTNVSASAYQMIINHGIYGNGTYLRFFSDDTLQTGIEYSSGIVNQTTSQVFRDTSAWMHIVWRVDTTQANGADRSRLYINGEQVTSFSLNETIPQNTDTFCNYDHGAYNDEQFGYKEASLFTSMYYADVYHVDGQSLAPTEFGEVDSASGIWKPIEADISSFGNNGYYLNFSNSSNLGEDTAGNGSFTLSNITAADQATDTPTNNFTTWNTIRLFNQGVISFKEGGTVLSNSFNGGWSAANNNIRMGKGKWYAEFEVTVSGNYLMNGNVDADYIDNSINAAFYLGSLTDKTAGAGYYSSGTTGNDTIYYEQTSTSSGVTTSAGDIISVAIDCDNNKVHFAVNGSWTNSSDPATNTNGFAMTDNEQYFALASIGVRDYKANFGGYTTISISSPASDSSGYGTFEYAPPSGYYALCTKNLAEYG
jgi:hypothetical protein